MDLGILLQYIDGCITSMDVHHYNFGITINHINDVPKYNISNVENVGNTTQRIYTIETKQDSVMTKPPTTQTATSTKTTTEPSTTTSKPQPQQSPLTIIFNNNKTGEPETPLRLIEPQQPKTNDTSYLSLTRIPALPRKRSYHQSQHLIDVNEILPEKSSKSTEDNDHLIIKLPPPPPPVTTAASSIVTDDENSDELSSIDIRLPEPTPLRFYQHSFDIEFSESDDDQNINLDVDVDDYNHTSFTWDDNFSPILNSTSVSPELRTLQNELTNNERNHEPVQNPAENQVDIQSNV